MSTENSWDSCLLCPQRQMCNQTKKCLSQIWLHSWSRGSQTPRYSAVSVFFCVVLGWSRRPDEMWPILDTDLPNTAGKHRNNFLELLPYCTLALFRKELSCSVTLETNSCQFWNALIIMENKPSLINYPDKLFCFFGLFQFSVFEQVKGKTQNPLRFVETNWCSFEHERELQY